MSKFTQLMLKYSYGDLELEEALHFEKILLENQDLKKEYLTNKRLDEYMRVQNLMQQVLSDPELPEIESITKNDVNNHIFNEGKQNINIASFINGEIVQNNEIEKLINEAEREMFSTGIDCKTMEWVTGWKEENKDQYDKYTLELINYVKSGMIQGSKPVIKKIRKKKGKTRKLLVYISSVAAVLMMASGIMVLYNTRINPNELYAEYYKPYKVISEQTRSFEEKYNIKYKNAIQYYENKNFSEASKIFNELLIGDDKSAKIQLINGISHLEEQQYEKALLSFEAIIHANGEYFIEAKWYLAMTYLKKQDIKSARLILKELTGTPGYYKEKAKELLKKL